MASIRERSAVGLIIAFQFVLAVVSQSRTYDVQLVSMSQKPVVSHVNPVGGGYTPCNLTFNPAWIEASDTFNQTGLLVRAAECPEEFGGNNDHIMFVPCTSDGVCGDLIPTLQMSSGSEDPRTFRYQDYYYNFYYAPGPGQYTVTLGRTQTPLDSASWQNITTQPWHRNGCIILRDQGPHYVLFGEGNIGLATTTDLVHYTIINTSFIEPLGAEFNEILLEAGSTPVTLSTGDYLHFYAAATPGWIPHGNYTAGWVILSGQDPTVILQRSTKHILVPLLPYQQGTDGYPWSRHNVIFLPSAVPTGNKDEFRLWFGAADASIGTAVVQVTVE